MFFTRTIMVKISASTCTTCGDGYFAIIIILHSISPILHYHTQSMKGRGHQSYAYFGATHIILSICQVIGNHDRYIIIAMYFLQKIAFFQRNPSSIGNTLGCTLNKSGNLDSFSCVWNLGSQYTP